MGKSGFTWMVIIGIGACMLSVLGPLHEVWHLLASLLSGTHATMTWDTTYIYGDVTYFIGYAGMYGEILTLTVLFFFALGKGKYKTAIFLFGYSTTFGVILLPSMLLGFIPVDLQLMIRDNNKEIVYLILYIWIAYYSFFMLFQVASIYTFWNQIILGERKMMIKGAKNRIKQFKNMPIGGENRQNRLTLVK